MTNRYPTRDETFRLRKRGRRIPVVFDTDIGGDIDDTWALAFLLRCPELDLKLVSTDAGNTMYRARLAARLLEAFDRTDVPVGIGIPGGDKPGNQSAWVGDYTLDDYPGQVYQDGVGALIEVIEDSPVPVTLICTGGVPTIKEALARHPSLCRKARFVGMHGSVYKGYGGGKPSPEANVRTDPAALRAVFAAPWDCTITPLDTCGLVQLKGDRYQRVRRCADPGIKALLDNYRAWRPAWTKNPPDTTRHSTVLFDTVAVYLAFSEDLCVMKDIPLRVEDNGMTVVAPDRRPIHCAVDWRNLEAFEDLLVERLTA